MNTTIVWSKPEKSEWSAYPQFITEIFEIDFCCMETRLSELSSMPSFKEGTIWPLKVFTYWLRLFWRHKGIDVSDHVYWGKCPYWHNMRITMDLCVRYNVDNNLKDRIPKEHHYGCNITVVMVDSLDTAVRQIVSTTTRSYHGI